MARSPASASTIRRALATLLEDIGQGARSGWDAGVERGVNSGVGLGAVAGAAGGAMGDSGDPREIGFGGVAGGAAGAIGGAALGGAIGAVGGGARGLRYALQRGLMRGGEAGARPLSGGMGGPLNGGYGQMDDDLRQSLIRSDEMRNGGGEAAQMPDIEQLVQVVTQLRRLSRQRREMQQQGAPREMLDQIDAQIDELTSALEM